MKANVKQRQTEAAMEKLRQAIDERDQRAFTLILRLILRTLSEKPWKWGPKRLRRLHDAAIAFMNRCQDDPNWSERLEGWAIEMGLTEEDMKKRQEQAKKEETAQCI